LSVPGLRVDALVGQGPGTPADPVCGGRCGGVGGLIPLARRGGPLWEPLCYVQIVGLLTATVVTLVIVPILYVLFVEDFRLIRWSPPGEHTPEGPPAEYTDGAAAVHGPGATTVGLR